MYLPSSYCPISLLPTFAKLFEKLILHRITPLIEQHNILPKSQFGFRPKHNTTHQIHRIVDQISTSFETKKFCPGVFLDISQAFDRVWRDRLLFKLKHFLPSPHYLIIKSYLENRYFEFITKMSTQLSRKLRLEFLKVVTSPHHSIMFILPTYLFQV